MTEAHIACELATWREIEGRLRAAAPNEACTFVIARPSRGTLRVTALLKEVLWPRPGEVHATPHSLELSADYISRVMDVAIDAGPLAGLALVHTHPRSALGPGIARFSQRDDWYDARLFPTLTLERPLSVCASIVIGSEPASVDARLWWNAGRGLDCQPVNVVRLVGPELTFLETPHSGWADHADPTMMDRSTRLWGASGRRILQNLRVGIVGIGGTGSVTLLALATAGVGRIRAWDFDTIKKENLHRMLGATKAMIGSNKVNALAPVINAIATADPFHFEPMPYAGTSSEGLRELKDCDLAFCSVDRFAPRVPLNDLAYAHLIPVIDMASWIHSSDGVVDAIMTHAHVWSPGIPCAWCRETLTSRRLTREAQGAQRGAEQRAPYGLDLEETEGVEPSVLPLNLAGVGLALLEFMQVALKVGTRTPRDLKLLPLAWELDESDLDTVQGCPSESSTGLGDTVVITPA